jgi:anti-sigma factor RsiW
VYQRHKHVITVFVAPAAAMTFPSGNARGFHRLTWRRDGFDWAAVSDLAADDLADFTSKLRDAPTGGEPSP